ncbi:trans-resveratrol di-O-methyltransferase-like [Corylus avellana]|uniref:trans-resveratrol di-O-methyltransferase-like n=1 Tax=Corylus avellana TaxID=13451 RepID=UPI00286C147D|nr:trans-resveratrol di-O-methyltransferase-like [Corylus avellana]
MYVQEALQQRYHHQLMDIVHSQGATELFEVQSHLYKHIFSFIDSMSLNCAIQLAIPDIIHTHARPITLPQLASKLHIHPKKTSCLHRLMRLLVHSGFFTKTKLHHHHQNHPEDDEEKEEEEEGYGLTPSSRLVVKDNVTSLSPFVKAMLDPVLVSPWHVLGDWLRGGSTQELTPFEKTHGMSISNYLNQNTEYGCVFNEAMASDSQLMSFLVDDYKPIFEGLGSLVDVGGGTGTVARIISQAFPHVKCTVFDLPHVVANLPETTNLKYVGGDMFQSIPYADALLFKWILHDWSDEECVNILKRCKEAITSKGKGGKVIIIDVVINEDKDEDDITKTKLFFDTLMMVVNTGKEREKNEWEKLFFDAGFTRYNIVASYGMKSVIELHP